jgi:HSP20 family protein
MALLMRPEPFSQEVNRLFSTLFDSGDTGVQRWVPAMDLTEADDHFVLRADLPGLGEDDVSIEIQDNTLTISGERKAEHEERQRGWYRVERSFGRFSRSLTLPEGVDADAVEAHFDKGVLAVRIPKPAERKPRRVAIKAGGANGNGAQPAVEGTAEEK